MSGFAELIQATIAECIAPDARVLTIQPRDGPQGYSGATLHYFDVTYNHGGANERITLVVKDAMPVERQTLAWLNRRALPAPFNYATDLTSEGRAPVCMQYVGDGPPPLEMAQHTAQALAAIHAAALGRADELPWLPPADAAFAAEWLVDGCWRRSWQSLIEGCDYIAPGGRSYRRPEHVADFAAEFGAYTQPLEDAAARLIRAIGELWDANDALTLIHTDFHGDQVRAVGERISLIDWDFAHYGPLYVDLPNYFTRAQALLYRDALAALGRDIPADAFLAHYDAIRPYPGFKYFSIGLYNWCYGDPPRQREYVLHFIDMILDSDRAS